MPDKSRKNVQKRNPNQAGINRLTKRVDGMIKKYDGFRVEKAALGSGQDRMQKES